MQIKMVVGLLVGLTAACSKDGRSSDELNKPEDDKNESAGKSDYGCPVAAARLLKKMKGCGLDTDGIDGETLCKGTPSQSIRFMSNLDSCDELLRLLNIEK